MNKKTDGYWYLEADDGKSNKQVRYLKTLVKWVRAQGNQQVCIQWFQPELTKEAIGEWWTNPEMTDEQICHAAMKAKGARQFLNLPARVMRADVVYVIEEH